MRQFMYTGDLARVVEQIVKGEITSSFNVAPPNQNYTIDQMAHMALKALEKDHWRVEYDIDKPDGQFRKDVGCGKMIADLGDFDFTSFEDGIRKVYERLITKG